MAGAEDADVGPAVTVDAVVLRPTEERVGTVAAVERVVAVAAEQLELEQSREAARTRDRVGAVKAVDSERRHAGHVHEGRDVRRGHPYVAGHRRRGDVDDIPRCRAEQPHEVSAALPVDRDQVAPLLGPPDAHVGGEAIDCDRAGPRADVDQVGAGGALGGDGVGLSVSGAAAEDAFEVDVRQRDIGAGEVVDDRVVGAAERLEVDPLDVVGVHGDVAQVAEEAEAVAVGGEVEVLGACGAVEQERVRAALALDDVTAVAGIPDERVVAGAEDADVSAGVPVHEIVPGSAEEHLGAGAAEQRVTAVLAVDRRRLRVGEDAVRVVDPDAVVAAARVDDDRVERGAVEAEVGRAVVADVDLQGRGDPRLQPEGELVACAVAGEGQRVVVDPRRVSGIRALGYDAEHGQKNRDDRHQPGQRTDARVRAGIQVRDECGHLYPFASRVASFRS